MDITTFETFANHRILQTTIELDGETYPSLPVKLPPLFCLAVAESGINLFELIPLTTRKKQDKLAMFSYRDIEKIVISPIKKLTSVVFALGDRLNLDIILHLTDGRQFHFECEDMSMLVQLAASLASHQVMLLDRFGLIQSYQDATSTKEGYQFLLEKFSGVSDERQLVNLRIGQVEE